MEWKYPNEQITWIKSKVPSIYDAEVFKNKFGADQEAANRISIVEEKFEVTFEMFWQIYQKLNNKNRKRAIAVWERQTKAVQIKAYLSLKGFQGYCARESKWYTAPLAENYINGEQYNNNWNK